MVWRKEESMDNQNEKKPTLEEAFTRIEAILTQMEQPEISLEESFSLYQQGVLQLKNCGTILDEVEKKMQILGRVNRRDVRTVGGCRRWILRPRWRSAQRRLNRS